MKADMGDCDHPRWYEKGKHRVCRECGFLESRRDPSKLPGEPDLTKQEADDLRREAGIDDKRTYALSTSQSSDLGTSPFGSRIFAWWAGLAALGVLLGVLQLITTSPERDSRWLVAALLFFLGFYGPRRVESRLGSAMRSSQLAESSVGELTSALGQFRMMSLPLSLLQIAGYFAFPVFLEWVWWVLGAYYLLTLTLMGRALAALDGLKAGHRSE